MKIGFIGLGNMADAMIGGMLKKNIVKAEDIIGTAKTSATREKMADRYGISIKDTNAETAKASDVLILAVKPQFLAEVTAQIKDAVTDETLIISIAAGKSIAWIEEAFGRRMKIVRCMPNTPALVGEGCTGVCVNERVSEEEKEYSIKLMESFGRASLVPEHLIDAVGAVSGSSPAYVFMFIEAMADAGVAAGMPRKQAYEFAAQAVYGSAKLVLESGRHPGELKDMVCSPGGTTIQGVRVLEEKGLRGAVMDALAACVEKSKQL
ncbi:MAG: pyrroline-5-carboxylate reductase [Roseburia sp.]|nr:pyrroline-5-carboxylate reductase [Ruminococcus sp.]MCM1154721.1 pyrroline-5-carboxylate reductase [Roseburia sp.]MCM1242999.1 pyrroline-5-carboxylate reductase [Roseburia sp.]